MILMASQTIIEILYVILGEPPPGLTFIYVLLAGILLVFVFHIIEHIFEILFSRFFKN